MGLLFTILNLAIQLYILVIIVQVVISWLIAFDVINASNEAAQNLINALKKLTDPVYKPLKKYIPPIGGIDITPLVVIILLCILQALLIQILL